MGHPLPVEVRQGGGQDVPQVSQKHHKLFQAPDHQRCQRSFELDDSNDQEKGLRFPQPGALQNCHLFSLRRLKPSPCYPQECRMSHIRKNIFIKN